ncbi:MAG: hypothetical protein H7840_09005 [Alphaproteobacteria bacterium]
MTLGLGSIVIVPHLPAVLLAALTVAAVVVLAIGLVRRARGAGLRVVAVAALLVALLDPRLVQERHTPRNDVAVIVVDESPSQSIGDRRAETAAALATVRERLAGLPQLEVRVERLEAAGGAALDEGTRLFAAVRRAVADVPGRRLAGVVLITDGQVHDVPADAGASIGAPVHTLLTGRAGEGDRRLVVERAPGYGIVGRSVSVMVRVEDSGTPAATAAASPSRQARLTIRRDGASPYTVPVPVGRPFPLQVDVTHGGTNVVEMEVEPGPAELSPANNRTALAVSGVRDRLRVLLISGRPHSGERTWRNILKSDPNVDLVHFTILRPLEKDDFTPLSELALITFPMRELFEDKLSEFDLVIFDRYSRHSLVPMEYIENLAQYVRKGGAVLVAVGPEFADSASLSRTPLGEVLPADPTGRVFEEGFRPEVTGTGIRHPVTAGLNGAGTGAGTSSPAWGRWLRHVDAEARGGEVLMTGVGGRPLLVLDRVDEGRVALLLSDTIWLWARGWEGGGPQAELLRRLAHWLMREPALEENALAAEVRAGVLTVTRRSLTPGPSRVTVTTPSGDERPLDLTEDGNGRATAALPVTEPGLYRIGDGERTTLAAAGSLNPPELVDLVSTDRLLRPVAEATGGGVLRLSQTGVPTLRRIRPGQTPAGRDWLGLVANGDYLVSGVREVPLMPPALALTLALGGLIAAWYREGR